MVQPSASTSVDNFSGIRRVLWVTMGLNLIATAAKLVVGYSTGALSLIADGWDSVWDSASNIIGLVGIGVAAQPADEEHPYGHRKAETLASLTIAVLLFITTWELARSAVERLLHPALITGQATVWSFVALGISIALHLTVVWYEMRAGRRLKSEVLVADAMHTRADVFVSLAVAGGLVAVRLGVPIADPIMALVVSLAIGKIGYDILREATSALMDSKAMPAGELETIALAVPGVVSVHRVRTRGMESSISADLHIRVDPGMSASQSHALAHEVRRRLHEAQPTMEDVTIHVEPSGSDGQETTQHSIATQLRRLADGLGLAVHSIWAYDVAGAYRVEVHVEAEGGLSLQAAHDMASELERRAMAEIPGVDRVTTHLEPVGRLEDGETESEPDAALVAAVQRVVEERLGPGACREIRVTSGPGGRALSVRCYLAPEMPLAEAHRLGDHLEHAILERVPAVTHVLVHTEPRPA